MLKTRYVYSDYRGGHFDSRCGSNVGGDIYLKCENCSHAEDEYHAKSYKFCPKCGAAIVRKGDNLRLLVKTMQSRQKSLMADMNSHGRYGHLDEVGDDGMENIIASVNNLYDMISETIKASV